MLSSDFHQPFIGPANGAALGSQLAAAAKFAAIALFRLAVDMALLVRLSLMVFPSRGVLVVLCQAG